MRGRRQGVRYHTTQVEGSAEAEEGRRGGLLVGSDPEAVTRTTHEECERQFAHSYKFDADVYAMAYLLFCSYFRRLEFSSQSTINQAQLHDTCHRKLLINFIHEGQIETGSSFQASSII